MTNEFKEVDHGWDEFLEAFRGAEDAHVTLGVHQEDNATQEGGDISLAKLMQVHEFGTVIEHPGGTPYKVIDGKAVFVEKGTPEIEIDGKTDPHQIPIPARPVLRHTPRRYRDEIADTSKQALKGVVTGQLSLKRGLSLIGEDVKGRIQATFGDPTQLEANAPSTQRKKAKDGHKDNNPLIEDGQLRSSIDYQVHDTN